MARELQPPLLRRSSTSRFLLISADGNPADSPAAHSLPRPKAWILTAVMAVLDMANAVVFTVLFAHRYGSNAIVLLVWNYSRAATLFALVGFSRRIRERGWLVALCSLVTLLLILYDSNSLIQHLPFPSQSNGHTNERHQRQSAPPVYYPIYLLSHLFFAVTHWLTFVFTVGVRRDVNPFGLGFSSFSSSYRERLVEHNEEVVGGDNLPSSRSVPSLLLPDEQQEEEGYGEEENLFESSEEEDANDIVDLPPVITPAIDSTGTLRSRSSRLSLRADAHPPAYDTFSA